jgi:ABC-type sugar transport system substrate-binding protein
MRRKANVAAIVLAAACVLLAAALALTMLGVTDAVFAPRKTFSTPEDAIRYFTERVQAGDYEGALKACAAGEIAQNYDYEAMINRIKTMGAYSPYFMPGDYGLYAAYNEGAVRQQILSQLRFMALSVVLPDEYAEYLQGSQIIEDSGSIDFDSVVEDMDPEAFLGLKIADIGQSALADTDANVDNLDAMADIYGAEEMAARDVLYEIDGDYYAGGFTLLQYNGSWLICQLGDPLIGQPVTGALIPLKDESDFDGLLGGDGVSTPGAESTPVVTVSEAPTPPAELSTGSLGLNIGVMLPGMESGWMTMASEDISAAAVENGCSATIQYANWDIATQIAQIEEQIVVGADVIVLWSISDSGYTDVLNETTEAGIFVVMLEMNEPVTPDGVHTVSLSFDQNEFGKALADWMYTNLGSDLTIGELAGPVDFSITDTLSAALKNAASSYAGWNVVETLNTDYTEESAKSMAVTILASSSVDVLYCHEESIALAAAEAVAEAGLTGQVSIVCFGSSQVAIDAVADGTISAVALYDLHYGEPLMNIIRGYAQGQTLDARYTMPPLMIDASNAAGMSGFSYNY